jgi:hypothetical protein
MGEPIRGEINTNEKPGTWVTDQTGHMGNRFKVFPWVEFRNF